MYSNALSLISDIRSGRRLLSDLTALEFEEVVFALLSRRLLHLGKGATISRELRGEIDFVVRIPYVDIIGSRETIHFIEAKNYEEKLTLDIAGKAFCATIRYRPATLIIACRSELQRQPLEYAKQFFTGSPTKFSLWNLTKTLTTPTSTNESAGNGDNLKGPLVNILTSEIWRNRIFQKELVHTSNSSGNTLHIASEDSYSISLFIETTAEADKAKYQIQFVSGAQMQDGSIQVDHFGDFSMLTAPLPIKNLMAADGKLGSISCELYLLVSTNTRQLRQVIQLPRLIYSNAASPWPDLRSSLVETWARRMTAASGIRLLYVCGEGGVGKTYFTAELCRAMQQIGVVDCAHLVLDQGDPDTFFDRLLSALLRPGSSRHDEFTRIKDDLIRATVERDRGYVLSSTMHATAEDDRKTVLSSLVERISVVAQCIANLGTSKVIVISNAQRMSPILVDGMRALIYSTEQFGWSNIALIIEYRDTSDQKNPALESLADLCIADRIGGSQRLRIEPLTYDELHVHVSKTFPTHEADWVTTTLINRTGGNCLFLDQLTRQYEAEGIVSISRSGCDSTIFIEKIAEFGGMIACSQPIQRLLADRLAYLDKNQNICSSTDNIISRITGLSALLNNCDGTIISMILDQTPDVVADIYNYLMRERIFVRMATDEGLHFIHDFMRDCCIERFSTLPTTIEDCRRTLAKIRPENAEACILRGRFYELIDFRREALSSYEEAFSRANSGDRDYALQRKALRSIDGLISRETTFNASQRLKHVEVLETLGWAENNAGSSFASVEAYERAYDVVRKSGVSSNIWTPSIVQQRLAAETHALFGLHVLRHDLVAAAGWARAALSLVDDPTRFGKILNRLVKLAVYWDRPGLAASFGALALRCAPASKDPEKYAVLAIDIGEIYLLENPEMVDRAREFGLTVAYEERQRLHNRVHRVTSNAVASADWSAADEALRILERAKSVGVRGVEEHGLNWLGVSSFLRRNVILAEYYFRTCKQLATVCGHRRVELTASCNLLSAMLAQRHVEAALPFWRDVCRQFDELSRGMRGPDPLDALLAQAEESADRLGAKGGLPNNPISDLALAQVPVHSGSLRVVSHVMATLRDTASSLGMEWGAPERPTAIFSPPPSRLPTVEIGGRPFWCIPE